VKVGEKKVEGRGFFWKIFQGSRGFEGGGFAYEVIGVEGGEEGGKMGLKGGGDFVQKGT